jgi:hypothetical protein
LLLVDPVSGQLVEGQSGGIKIENRVLSNVCSVPGREGILRGQANGEQALRLNMDGPEVDSIHRIEPDTPMVT